MPRFKGRYAMQGTDYIGGDKDAGPLGARDKRHQKWARPASAMYNSVRPFNRSSQQDSVG